MDKLVFILMMVLSSITSLLMFAKVIGKKDFTILAGVTARIIFVVMVVLLVYKKTIPVYYVHWTLVSIFAADVVVNAVYFLSRKWRDIIENARLEKTLEDIKYKYKVLLETSPVGFYVINERGIIEYINKALLDLGGYELAEVLYRPISNFVIPEEKKLTDDVIKTRMEEHILTDSYFRTLVKKDGSKVKVKVYSNLTTNGHATITGSVITLEQLNCEE